MLDTTFTTLIDKWRVEHQLTDAEFYRLQLLLDWQDVTLDNFQEELDDILARRRRPPRTLTRQHVLARAQKRYEQIMRGEIAPIPVDPPSE